MGYKDVNVVVGGYNHDGTHPQTYKTVILKAGIPLGDQLTDENTIYVVKWDFEIGINKIYSPLDFTTGGTMVIDGVTYYWSILVSGADNNTLNLCDNTVFFCQMHSDVLIPERSITLNNGEAIRVVSPLNTYHEKAYYTEGNVAMIPNNCILRFDGGSFDKGILVLNNTYVESYKGFKKNLVVTGTVENSVIESTWFEMPVEDVYNQFKYIFEISRLSRKPVDIAQGDYNVVWNLGDDEEKITISQDVDFNNSNIVFDTNNHANAYYRICNNESEDVPVWDLEGFRSLVNGHLKVNETTEKYKNCFVELKTDVDEFQRNHRSAAPFKQTEVLYVDCDGYVDDDSYFNEKESFGEITDAMFFHCDNKMKISNATITVVDEFDGTSIAGDYRYLLFRTLYCSHITFENLVIHKNVDPQSKCSLAAHWCYDLQYRNIDMASWTTHAITENVGSAVYNLDLSEIVNITMDNVKISGLENVEKWGDTGSNYIYNWVLRDCDLTRVDVHYRLHNIFAENCRIGSKGMTFTGWGKAMFLNCSFLCDKIIQSRSDYGSFFDGDIILQNCKWFPVGNTGHPTIADSTLSTFDFKCISQKFSSYLARNIIINEFTIEKSSAAYIMPIVSNTASLPLDVSSYEIVKRNYPKMKIDGANYNKCYFTMNICPYYDDFFLNDREIYIRNSKLNSNYSSDGFTELFHQSPYRDMEYVINNLTSKTIIKIDNCEEVPTHGQLPNCDMYISNSTLTNTRPGTALGYSVSINYYVDKSTIILRSTNWNLQKTTGDSCWYNCTLDALPNASLGLSLNTTRGIFISGSVGSYYNCRYSKALADRLLIGEVGEETHIPYDTPLVTREMAYAKEYCFRYNGTLVYWDGADSAALGKWYDALGNEIVIN